MNNMVALQRENLFTSFVASFMISDHWSHQNNTKDQHQLVLFLNIHMGHFPEDGENEQNVSFFSFFFEASL